ncbi:MAG: Protein C of soluble methane monooxygenase [candidate division WWE3 bacterium GW2011_GWC1_41_7]|uniref:Protein C of soluble methane monooxygenase n=2 Tax=Katanobacteria TaxID=422282 RepID=A0A0G0ZGN1_UNCKA|nr:MAG: Protein C of soluble methane monooxygenase [candidate division WWE3 bacterium GW2011_GWC1_41_7]KKS21834.1 MAG: Protein C of soluble methane monooxygenase [candidate division WWE3 bacterium GW2011_GWA1_41_8]
MLKPVLFNSVVSRTDNLTNKLILVTFKVTDPERIDFTPGQFVNLRVVHAPMTFRSYSICSDYRVTSQFSVVASVSHEGPGSNFLRSLKPGDNVEFIGPSGRFNLEEPLKDKIIFVATGTGVAPFIPMLHYLEHTQFEGDVFLFFGVRHEDEIFFKDELDNFMVSIPHFTYQICVSQPGNWFGNIGRVNSFVLVDSNAGYYLCGHPEMVEDLSGRLLKAGVPSEHILFEKFTVKGPPMVGSPGLEPGTSSM